MPRSRPPKLPIALLSTIFFVTGLSGRPDLAAQPPDSIDFFENRIRPVLVERCYECHSADVDEVGGSLLLDSSGGMMVGGDSGPAIDPGNVEGSVLISAIRYESSEMPPDGRLPEKVVNDFEQWIAAGAIDPRTASHELNEPISGIDLEAGRQFWAFQPIADARPPDSNMPASAGPIDRFLGDRLSQAGVVPNDLADPEVRLRRLAFDLTGLPPDRALQRRWLADPSPKHWREIVDSMLASPAFAEHWARHWMDVARYADSNGSDFNATHHEAWRYRDYLIRCFAADRPLDQMIRQQIAGDLLPAESDQERHDNLVATTFLMIGTKMLSERDKAKLTLDVVDEQIDTIGRAFLGMTLGCARCHDHKFDPIPTEDYYALAGIFKSTITLNGESQKYVSTWNRLPLPTSGEHRARVQRHEAKRKLLQADIARAEKAWKSAKEEADAGPGEVIVEASALVARASGVEAAKRKLDALKADLKRLDDHSPPPIPEAMAPTDRPTDQIGDSPVHIRGEVTNLGTVVPRGFLRVCSGFGKASIHDPRGSGRIELADWLTDPDHPLVARVFVNRVWMHLMGQGLVRTPDNFGFHGDRPSHPELLDWLATEFTCGGWQLKPLIRRIVSSDGYARSSDAHPHSIAVDPENRLLWRMHRRRIPAESIRDAMLAVAGKLDRRPRTEPMKGRGTLVSKNNGDSSAKFDDVSQSCRSIYLPVVRGYLPPMMAALDVADPDMLVGRRPTTNVPAQALVLINSPDVNAWALATAQRIMNATADFDNRLDLAFRLCLQRGPRADDRRIADQHFSQRRNSLDAWHQYVAATFASTEFRLLD